VKLEMLLWIGVGVFYAVLGAIYWASDGDPAGASLVLMATALGGLCGGWIWDWRRRHRDRLPRPEDAADADAADATGVVGVYPTASLRPLALAVGLCATALGVVLGSWMLLGGVAIVASQVALLVRDADR
jgi:hypothetical protein